jgi:hypothetical protein
MELSDRTREIHRHDATKQNVLHGDRLLAEPSPDSTRTPSFLLTPCDPAPPRTIGNDIVGASADLLVAPQRETCIQWISAREKITCFLTANKT